MNSFEQQISNADLSLFERIESQSTEKDKKSLLTCQFAVRELTRQYNYLEIGSYLGGSIQPHLMDERCKKIYSIDKRPEFQPDERGVAYQYQNNSTRRMLELLETVSAENISKITTIDADTGEINASQIKDKIDLCFIDGEHTDEAVFSDFLFSFNTLQENGGGNNLSRRFYYL
ncbi:MAG: class I SAM-dependent methyltransferase [Aridibacter sp.]